MRDKPMAYYGIVWACHEFLTRQRSGELTDEDYIIEIEDALKYYRKSYPISSVRLELKTERSESDG